MVKFGDISWTKEWFEYAKIYPKNHWKDRNNQRVFLDKVAKALKITNPSDWGKITTTQIIESGGGTLLNDYYKGSLFNTLQSVYPGMQ